MKTIKIKTIDIQAKEWFDKINGNSYFSAQVTINFGLKDQKTINIPFQYGYGEQYIYESCRQLQTEGILPADTIYSFTTYCQENDIILRTFKKDKCLKSEVKNFVSY